MSEIRSEHVIVHIAPDIYVRQDQILVVQGINDTHGVGSLVVLLDGSRIDSPWEADKVARRWATGEVGVSG